MSLATVTEVMQVPTGAGRPRRDVSEHSSETSDHHNVLSDVVAAEEDGVEFPASAAGHAELHARHAYAPPVAGAQVARRALGAHTALCRIWQRSPTDRRFRTVTTAARPLLSNFDTVVSLEG